MTQYRKLLTRYMRARYWILRENLLPKPDPERNYLTELLEAEEDLWEALTGERDLFKAMVAGGHHVLPRDDPSRPPSRRRKTKPAQSGPRRKKRRRRRPEGPTKATKSTKKRGKRTRKKLPRGFLE